MTDLELIFTALGEAATKIYTEDLDAQGFEENQEAATKGGNAAGNARRTFEQDTKRQMISNKNFLNDKVDFNKIEKNEIFKQTPPPSSLHVNSTNTQSANPFA
jgi:DNA-damage-inducible protein D